MRRVVATCLAHFCSPAARLLPWGLLYLLAALRGASDACCTGAGQGGLWLSAAAFSVLMLSALRLGPRRGPVPAQGERAQRNAEAHERSGPPAGSPELLLSLAHWTPLALYLVFTCGG